MLIRGWRLRLRLSQTQKNPIQKETYSAHKDSRLSHHKDAALDSPSKSDVAMVQKICESLKNLSEKSGRKELLNSQRDKIEIVYEISNGRGGGLI